MSASVRRGDLSTSCSERRLHKPKADYWHMHTPSCRERLRLTPGKGRPRDERLDRSALFLKTGIVSFLLREVKMPSLARAVSEQPELRSVIRCTTLPPWKNLACSSTSRPA